MKSEGKFLRFFMCRVMHIRGGTFIFLKKLALEAACRDRNPPFREDIFRKLSN